MSKRIVFVLAILITMGSSSALLRSEAQPAQQTSATPAATAQVTPPCLPDFTLINLNTGTSEQFLTIPDMNNRMVREFNEYRPYTSISQFRREIGKYVDADQVAAYEQYVYVPVQVVSADAATLKQIPGVTDEIANQLIAAQPFNSNEAFLLKLGEYLTADQVSYASNYLDVSDVTPAATLSAGTQATPCVTATETAAQPFTLINLNTGTAEQFLAIPDMNNRMVREFNEYRPYVSILQFRREIGKYVDEAQVAAYERYVYVPVQVASADAATLKQIPGVTDEIANQLIAAQPYSTNEAFLLKLGEFLTADQVSYATNYLEAAQ
jgi:DNA uptake protein ComE-like DNA-binding protein